MNVKRMLTGLIGFPLVILLLVIGNKYILDIITVIMTFLAIHEYSKVCSKEVKSLSWIGYVLSLGIVFIHILNIKFAIMAIIIFVPLALLLFFLQIIITNMKITLKDVAISFLGFFYIIVLIMFIPLIYGIRDTTKLNFLKEDSFIDVMVNIYQNTVVPGKYLIWYLVFASWGSDTFAYLIGKNFGKHKFSRVSPNKTIEGCAGGIFGAVLLSVIYTIIINNINNFGINYLSIGIISVILCIIGQVGDFSASTIKRYFEVKDFSNLFPGHGGMLDRIDSVMFIAPFAFLIFAFIL